MSTHRHTARDHVFSLIEMLVVVIVLGVLAGVAIPVYLNQRAKARNVQTLTDLRNVHRLVEAYATENGAALPHHGWTGGRLRRHPSSLAQRLLLTFESSHLATLRPATPSCEPRR